MDLLKLIKDVGKTHGSTICFIAGMAGVGLVIYEAWTTRPKVDKILTEQKAKREEIEKTEYASEDDKSTALTTNTVETVKKVSVASIKLGAATIGTIGCIAGSKMLDARTIANLTTTVQLGELAYKNLSDSLPEVLGEEKANEVKAVATQKDVDARVSTIGIDGIEQGKGGDVLFYDVVLARPFYSDCRTILNEWDKLRHNLELNDMYVLYSEFVNGRLELTAGTASEEIGWPVDDLLKDGFSPNLNNTVIVGGRPAIALDWWRRPTKHYK